MLSQQRALVQLLLVVIPELFVGMSAYMDIEFAGDVNDEIIKMSTELRFLLGNGQIPLEVQAMIANLGLTDMDVFAKIADDVAGFRAFVADDLHVAPNETKKKVLIARLVSSWEAACVRGTKRKADDADRRVGDLPRRFGKSAHLTLQRAFADTHNEDNEDLLPGKPYVEGKLDEIEDGELIAESLKNVIARSDTCKGMKPQEAKGSLPSGPEEFRTKMLVMANCWEMVRMQLPDHSLLQGFKPNAFDRHVRWILGKDVRGFEVKNEKGITCYQPSWPAVLAFEHEVRKKAMKACSEGDVTLTAALKDAMEDNRLYQKLFLNPLSAVAGAAAAAAAASTRIPWSAAAAKPLQADAPAMAAEAPAAAPQKLKGKVSEQLCFAFQRGNCQGCERLHLCEICLARGVRSADHGSKICPHKPV